MRNLTKLALAGAALVAFGGTAQAALPACSVSDISPTAQNCAGFFGGNLINQSKADLAASQAALNSIGFTGSASNQIEVLSPLNGTKTIDFSAMLSGITYIGLHFGNGQGSPSNGDVPGGTTAFYVFDAGLSTDKFFISAYNSSSNAALYSTGTPRGAVPEPATWAMMLVGFGAAGASLRRRAKPAFQAA